MNSDDRLKKDEKLKTSKSNHLKGPSAVPRINVTSLSIRLQ